MASGAPHSHDPLRIAGVPEPFNDPFSLADFAAHHVRPAPQFVPTPGGSGAMLRALLTSQVDAAFMLTDCLVAAVDAGHPVKCASQLVTSPLLWAIVVSHAGPKRHVHDLSRAVWGVSRLGSGSHLMARLLAARHDWPSQNFHVCGNFDGLTTAVKASTVDAFLWEKFTTKPFQRSGDVDIIGDIPTPWGAFCVAVRTDLSPHRLSQVRAVSDAFLIKAAHWVRDPSTVDAIVHKYRMTHEDARAWTSATQYAKPHHYRLSLDEIHKLRRALLHSGVITHPAELDDDSLVDRYCI